MNTLKTKAFALLSEHHPNELGRLMGIADNHAMRLVHEIYIKDWKLDGWHPECLACGTDGFALFSSCGTEYIDENGDYLFFETKTEAQEYADEFINEIEKVRVKA